LTPYGDSKPLDGPTNLNTIDAVKLISPVPVESLVRKREEKVSSLHSEEADKRDELFIALNGRLPAGELAKAALQIALSLRGHIWVPQLKSKVEEVSSLSTLMKSFKENANNRAAIAAYEKPKSFGKGSFQKSFVSLERKLREKEMELGHLIVSLAKKQSQDGGFPQIFVELFNSVSHTECKPVGQLMADINFLVKERQIAEASVTLAKTLGVQTTVVPTGFYIDCLVELGHGLLSRLEDAAKQYHPGESSLNGAMHAVFNAFSELREKKILNRTKIARVIALAQGQANSALKKCGASEKEKKAKLQELISWLKENEKALASLGASKVGIPPGEGFRKRHK
jgi:hypothetical protein